MSEVGSVDLDQWPAGAGGNDEVKLSGFLRGGGRGLARGKFLAMLDGRSTPAACDGGPLTGDLPIETLG